MKHETKIKVRVWFHTALTVAWAVNLPLALVTGWIYSVAYVAVCSIYANMVGHWSAREGALTDLHTPNKE
jgi:hypothetical protein